MKNEFEQIFSILEEFRTSKVPADRLFYLDSLKEMIKIGERLNALSPSDETEEVIQRLKDEVKDYKIYLGASKEEV